VIQEFKDFVNRGGVFEAAVGLIMALAFAPVVTSLVNDVIMQIIAAVVGQPNFRTLTFSIGDAQIFYGNFINTVISFVSIAFVVFLLVKAYNQMNPPKPEEDSGPTEIELLTEIRDNLAK
jgi:large conductance mechanosensitive channel